MNSPSISSLVQFSLEKTKELLFPFNPKRWIKILFIVWLSGHIGGSGGSSNLPFGKQPTAPSTEQTQLAQPSQTGEQGFATTTTPTPSQEIAAENQVVTEADQTSKQEELMNQIKVALPLIILIAIPFFIFFAWLSARFNFIFLDLLVNRDVRIRASFKAHKEIGNSYFLWSLGFMCVTFICIGGPVALILFGYKSFSPVLLLMLIPIGLLLFIALMVIGLVIIDFVVPMMHRDNAKAMATFKKFLFLKPSWGQIALYILLKIGLGILSSIIALVVVIAVAVVFLIAALIIGIPIGMLANVAPMLKPIVGILLGLGVVVSVIGLIFGIGLATLPIPIFFRIFAISYLHKLFPEYNLLRFDSSGDMK